MKVIGITGGIGAGKSEVLSYLSTHCNCRIIYADIAAKELEEPGRSCYQPLISLLGSEILGTDGRIDKVKFADRIFGNAALLEAVNGIIHPAVKEYILEQIASEKEMAKEKRPGFHTAMFVEAALLIEEGYQFILDELWYVYASEEVRRKRLKESRHYSDEKIDAILAKQLPEQSFREICKVVIRNDGSMEETARELDKLLGEYL
ncbi:MAG: dephospho-CoA kinase [Lachnospiraceae bacterium]|nr:dephospho-CoA kinase [Lachnospiraceae bacterium]